MLIDNHNRVISYVRLAVTDRCNLRCNYCMPEKGISFAKRNDLLSIDELKILTSLLSAKGIDKIRLTGGEPFVRNDVMDLIAHLSEIPSLKEISITTNATQIGPHIEALKQFGIHSVNVSLDAMSAGSFKRITRRDQFNVVYKNIIELIEVGIKVRINCIVLEGQNESEIYPMLNFQKNYPVEVRFLEEMPFNGGSRDFNNLTWNYHKILNHISERYPEFEKLPTPITSTSVNYKIPGHKGSFGIIPSFSRTFCGSCNRLRITATGDVITCLYGKPVANLRPALRSNDIKSVENIIEASVGSRARDGFEAQERTGSVFGSSMTSIGG